MPQPLKGNACKPRRLLRPGCQRVGVAGSGRGGQLLGPRHLELRSPYTLKELGSADPSFELLVGADKERGDGRRVRLTEADPAIPGIVYWFMLVTLAVTVAAFAFSLPRRKNGVEIITLMILAVLFTLSLLLIRDVNRAFGGVIAVDASAMQRTEEDLTEDVLAEYGQVPLPYDEQGRPTS